MTYQALTPIKLANTVIKNRIIFPSMCNFYCDDEGFVTERLKAFIDARVKGGTGLFILPGSPHGKPSAARPALSESKYLEGWRQLAEICHKEDCKLFVQLHPAKSQAGREENQMLPDHMPLDMIHELIESYAQGAYLAKLANLDGVEIHGAHAHEVAQFMSPYYNHRNDDYGGNYEKRALFSIQIVKAIKEKCGMDFPIIFKISSSEMIDGGRTIDETVLISQLLESAGVDAFDVSIGMPDSEQYISGPMDLPDAFNIDEIYQVKQAVNVPVIAINRINTPQIAEEILVSGKADMIAIGRGQLADPEFVNKMTTKEPICYCVGCNQGCRASVAKKAIYCMQNVQTGRESSLIFKKASNMEKSKKIIIAGAGVAGLEAACILAKRGFKPVIYEKSDKIGGLINLAMLPPNKNSMKRMLDYRVEMLGKYGIEIRLNTEVTPELVMSENASDVIVATGSTALRPPIKGINSSNVYTGDEIFRNDILTGKKVAILGGGLIGCEVAEFLAARGNVLTLFEMDDDLAKALNKNRRYFLLRNMSSNKVEIHLNTVVKQISLPNIMIETDHQIHTLSGFDAVVVAAGRKPERMLAEEITSLSPDVKVHIIGDANKVGMAIDAVWNGAEVASSL
jgi:2,4-dienoyl-CoA reductase-like NADH-dependent reductase (Old Yellow Enzyme family)/thioredoxin reductase